MTGSDEEIDHFGKRCELLGVEALIVRWEAV